MAYLKNTAVYPAFSLENKRKLLIICKIEKMKNECIKKLFRRQEKNPPKKVNKHHASIYLLL